MQGRVFRKVACGLAAWDSRVAWSTVLIGDCKWLSRMQLLCAVFVSDKWPVTQQVLTCHPECAIEPQQLPDCKEFCLGTRCTAIPQCRTQPAQHALLAALFCGCAGPCALAFLLQCRFGTCSSTCRKLMVCLCHLSSVFLNTLTVSSTVFSRSGQGLHVCSPIQHGAGSPTSHCNCWCFGLKGMANRSLVPKRGVNVLKLCRYVTSNLANTVARQGCACK